MKRYEIKVSRAAMPASCWGGGSYYRIGILEVEKWAPYPAMISDHARGVIRVVRTWERLYRGTTDRCAFGRAYAEAEALLEELESAA